MTATIAKAGPYFSSGEIKFSTLRNLFKETSSGTIKASELRRNTTTTNTNPVVPDATENSSISTASNLALSQFRNSIKYYYITQTGTDINFDIDAQSWNSNLSKNIRKWMYINGICASNNINTSAADFNATAYNLTVDVAGGIYGAGGIGGTISTISGSSGGNALSMRSSGGNNIVVFVRNIANIYGGGGGGEKGAKGADGNRGICSDSYTTSACGTCPPCNSGYVGTDCRQGGGCANRQVCNWWGNCWRVTSAYTQTRTCTRTYNVNGGIGGEGGNGGPGRGYNYFSGSLSGSAGSAGGPNNGCGSTNGLTGETGGSGGDWGNAGGNTNNTGNGGVAGRAIEGSNYSVVGTINGNTIRGSYNP